MSENLTPNHEAVAGPALDPEMQRKNQAVLYVAGIASELGDDDRDLRLPEATRQWTEWSEAVIKPLTTYAPQRLLGGSAQLELNDRLVCNDEEGNPLSQATPLQIRLFARAPHEAWEESWEAINDAAWDAVRNPDRQPEALWYEDLPKDHPIWQLASQIDLSPRVVEGQTKRLHRPVLGTKIDYTGLQEVVKKHYVSLMMDDDMNSVDFKLGIDGYVPGHPWLTGYVVNPARELVRSQYNMVDDRDYEGYNEPHDYWRLPFSRLVDSLNDQQLSAAADHQLDPDVVKELLSHRLQKDAIEIAEESANAYHLLELLVKSELIEQIVAEERMHRFAKRFRLGRGKS